MIIEEQFDKLAIERVKEIAASKGIILMEFATGELEKEIKGEG